jgi:hypothetical protein
MTQAQAQRFTSSLSEEDAARSQNQGRRPASTVMSSVKDGFTRAFNVTTNVAARAGRAAYGLVEDHHKALMSGVRAQRATMYELSAKRMGDGYTRGVESAREYYKAVDKYYTQNNTRVRAIPAGPMQDLARISGYTPTTAELQFMAQIDKSYREGNIDVIMPGGITFPGTRANLFIETYEHLSPSQILGYENTVVIQMNGEEFKPILELHGVDVSKMVSPDKVPRALASVMFENMVVGGSVFVNADLEHAESLRETLSHEMQHAGDGAVFNEARMVLQDPNATAQEKKEARRAFEATDAVFTKRVDQVSPALEGLITNNYYAGVNEFRAYTEQIHEHTDKYRDQIAENQNISHEEAEKIIEEIQNDPVIREINTVIDNYAASILEGGDNE